MQPNDRPAFAECLAGLASLYSHKLTDAALELWWRSLQDWPIAEFRDAASLLVTRCQFMPKPADFAELRQAVLPTATEQWARCVAECSRWRTGVQGDTHPLVDAALKAIGGNEAIAMCPDDRLHWLEKRFCAAYDELTDVHLTRAALPQLAHADLPRLT